jgi:glucose/arabinose dehydrogenase
MSRHNVLVTSAVHCFVLLSRRRGHAALAAALAWLPLLTSLHAPAAGALEVQPVLSGLTSPVYLTSSRDGSNRMFIVEQPGRIQLLSPGASAPAVFLDITARVRSGGERGLLGLAFHPRYAINRRFFVNYTRQPDGATVIAEYRASASDPDAVDPEETELLVIPQPFANHNGGMIEFGPDGYLYIGMGDGGSGNDPGNRAQNIDELLGKMLRIDVDHRSDSRAYSIPPDNPFAGELPGRDEIYAVGLRNPFRFSFDRARGQLFAGDVGQGAREEIDRIKRGGNYGWRVFEGSRCTGLDPAACGLPGFVAPIAEYGHGGGRCAVIGGYVYRGARSAFERGAYVYGDLCSGEIFRLFPARSGGSQSVALDSGLRIASFGEDEAGEIYVLGLGGGTIDRLTASPPPPPCSFAIEPGGQEFGAKGGKGSLQLSAASDCRWLAASHAPWIRLVTSEAGSGEATLFFRVRPNPGSGPREGIITVAGQSFAVTQSACDRRERGSGKGRGGRDRRPERSEGRGPS